MPASKSWCPFNEFILEMINNERTLMTGILDTIVAAKKKEIEKYKPLSSFARFERDGFFWKNPNLSLLKSLQAEGSTGIIAEFKRKSPSKGWFQSKELEVEKVVRAYSNLGASGISVLTDDDFFGGDLDDLIQARIISDVPVLRKDFIVDPWQIAESRAFGADVILLIAACLTPGQVKEFSTYARSIGLEVLLEIHGEHELDHICDTVDLVGVNNRNLKTFEVKMEKSLDLVQKLPAGIPAIAESGIRDAKTIVTLKKAGFRGFLVGELFMSQPDPGLAFEHFIIELKAK